MAFKDSDVSEPDLPSPGNQWQASSNNDDQTAETQRSKDFKVLQMQEGQVSNTALRIRERR